MKSELFIAVIVSTAIMLAIGWATDPTGEQLAGLPWPTMLFFSLPVLGIGYMRKRNSRTD